MRSRVCPSAVLTLAALTLAPHAHACAMENLEITDAPKAKVGVFDASGKFEREVDKALVVHARVVACNEALGLVQITQADGKPIWIDPIEVKIPVAASDNSKVCVTNNSAKDPDRRQVVSSGAQPDRNCKK